MKELISVIIPVFNAEKSIKQTLISILNQTYDNLEILVIDDGSTDRTAGIIKAIKDPRIVYIFQHNQGPASAKNTGIKKFSGEWLIFVDADDLIEKSAIEKLHSFATKKKSDLVIYSYARINKENEVIDKVNVSSIHIDEMFTAVWNKFYKKSIFNDLYFPEGTYFEDVSFSAMAATIAHNIVAMDEYFYLYKQHENSLTKKNWLPVRHEDIIKDFDYMYVFFHQKNILLSSDQKYEIRNLINKVLFSHIYQIAVSKNGMSLKNKTIVKLIKYQEIINNGYTITYSTSKVLNVKNKMLILLAKLRLYFLIKIIGSFSNKMRRSL